MLAFFALFFFRHPTVDTPVRATLGDGQILLGRVETRTLRLESGAGTLEIPLADVGEVVPVAAGGLGESEGEVDVWLRNGSELHGRWADPHLDMGIEVGGARVPVALPMNELARFQLQGGAAWPEGPVYRLRTRGGDDFLVDPTRTHLVLQNGLGTFSPLLSECRYVAPVDDAQGAWRVELETGTVLLGKLQDNALSVALPMGPETMDVPLDQFVSLRMESWGRAATGLAREAAKDEVTVGRGSGGAFGAEDQERSAAAPMPSVAAPSADEPAPAVYAPETDDGWFTAAALSATKRAQP